VGPLFPLVRRPLHVHERERRGGPVLPQRVRTQGHLARRPVYELASNDGPSVTNAAASIATQVWRQLLPDAKEGIIVVEAYRDRDT